MYAFLTCYDPHCQLYLNYFTFLYNLTLHNLSWLILPDWLLTLFYFIDRPPLYQFKHTLSYLTCHNPPGQPRSFGMNRIRPPADFCQPPLSIRNILTVSKFSFVFCQIAMADVHPVTVADVS